MRPDLKRQEIIDERRHRELLSAMSAFETFENMSENFMKHHRESKHEKGEHEVTRRDLVIVTEGIFHAIHRSEERIILAIGASGISPAEQTALDDSLKALQSVADKSHALVTAETPPLPTPFNPVINLSGQ